MLTNKDFYKYTKEYALKKLTAGYQAEKGLTPSTAREQAEKRLALLIKPVESCDVNSPKATISAIYRRLLVSCQNRTMMPNVIKFDANRTVFEKLLENFEPTKVLAKYKNADEVYKVFESTFNINKDRNSLWVLFSKSVIDGAKFMSKYKDVKAFRQEIDNIAQHSPSVLAVPRFVCEEIRGLGEILACDFIKEIGYIEYAKPDVHIEYIIKKLCKNEDMAAKEILNKVQEIAQDSGVSTFEVDKILWLIASGKYYDIYQVEPTIVVKSEHAGQNLRDEFLASLPK
ncbi:MAG: hypothetical protein IJ184_02890 [Alphaproteobacteria bacterium]|nr:hypothetical protein [Alphaproteobacteria bacterium]